MPSDPWNWVSAGTDEEAGARDWSVTSTGETSLDDYVTSRDFHFLKLHDIHSLRRDFDDVGIHPVLTFLARLSHRRS